jgi:hypothetical protein
MNEKELAELAELSEQEKVDRLTALAKNVKSKKELLKLINAFYPLEKKSEKQPGKRVAKNPKDFNNLTLSIVSNTGYSYADYEGQIEERGLMEYLFKNKRGQQALVLQSKISSLLKKYKPGQGLIIPPPDTTVSQLKNLHTLIVLLERRNDERVNRGKDKTNVIEFYLKEYEEVRGKTEEELARGGKFRDLCFLQLKIPHFCKYFSQAPVGNFFTNNLYHSCQH